MNTKYKQSYEGTKYPKKFIGTYWGRGRFLDGNDVSNARNRFVEDYNIKTSLIKVPFIKKLMYHYCFSNVNNEFDHKEFYSTNDKEKIIIITSPYVPFETHHPILWENMEKIGWKPYECLYPNAHTYIIEINKNQIRQLKLPSRGVENIIY